ncbi:MAG: DUF502 domain-containing protein [Candidatus Muirbacterium halophilum]|nr:DUF502 domain-containing protein [Candidatus Muirbacterium halophilum]MCK9474907.1 DUF502 domain-containing protein [Candidatus Muirbacterium halophilum]
MLKKRTKVFFTGLKILFIGFISKLWSYTKTYFFTGLIVLLPSALTIYVLVTIFTWADSGFIAAYINKTLRYKIPGLGFIFTIGMIIFSGVVARNFIGEKLFFFVEKLLLKIPLAKNIMTAVRQLLDFMSKNKKEVFNKVVLLEYPRKECWVIGFVSTDAPNIVNETLNQKLTSIFVPTTPNPTSGFLVFLPKSEIIEINITMEEAMKIIVSGGVLSPEDEEKDFLVKSDSEDFE